MIKKMVVVAGCGGGGGGWWAVMLLVAVAVGSWQSTLFTERTHPPIPDPPDHTRHNHSRPIPDPSPSDPMCRVGRGCVDGVNR